MVFRRLAFGLSVVFTLFLLGACQGTSTQPPDPATTTPAAAPTIPLSPTALPPNPTAVPAAPGPTEEPPAKTDALASSDVAQPTSTPQPTPTEEPDTVVATAPEPTQEPDESQRSASNDGHTGTEGTTSGVRWSFNGTAWSPNGTPPSCAEPFVLQTPVDMNIVTSALWPGQVRGAYVAHGGFRFDANVDNSVTVRAPIGSHLVQASRYLEGDDVQYLLFFSVPCGFFYRFDHVRVVSPTLADALKDIPAAVAGDSRTTVINPPVWLEQGEIVGTSVGVAPSNIFVDFGLYDVRTPNNVTPNPAWADLYAGDKEFGHYGVCFFDYLSGNDGEIMRSLPTGVEGKTSDYCQ